MMKQTALVGGLLLLFGAFAATKLHFSSEQIYHGVSVNLATEQRNDRWWQNARAEVGRDSKFHIASVPPPPKIIFRGSPDEKMVAITFDDGPHPGKVEELLTLLKQLDVRATFFVVGKMVERHPELIKMEAAAGHEIANHSFSHVNLSKIPETDVETEYRACSDLINHTLGYRPRFCRPPGGQATADVMEGAARNGLVTAMWSDDPKDYSNPGSDLIAERLMKHVGKGAIILLHEGVDETMEVLPSLIARLRGEGYQFVTMSELYHYSKVLPKAHSNVGHMATMTRSVPARLAVSRTR